MVGIAQTLKRVQGDGFFVRVTGLRLGDGFFVGVTVFRQGDGFPLVCWGFRLRARPALVWRSEFCVVAVISGLTRNLWMVNGWVAQTLKRVQGDGFFVKVTVLRLGDGFQLV